MLPAAPAHSAALASSGCDELSSPACHAALRQAPALCQDSAQAAALALVHEIEARDAAQTAAETSIRQVSAAQACTQTLRKALQALVLSILAAECTVFFCVS